MKIDFNKVSSAYMKNIKPRPSDVKNDLHKSANMTPTNIDTISISRTATTKQGALSIGHEIATDAERSVTPARLQQLKEAVENKTYYIPTQELANSILGRFAE